MHYPTGWAGEALLDTSPTLWLKFDFGADLYATTNTLMPKVAVVAGIQDTMAILGHRIGVVSCGLMQCSRSTRRAPRDAFARHINNHLQKDRIIAPAAASRRQPTA